MTSVLLLLLTAPGADNQLPSQTRLFLARVEETELKYGEKVVPRIIRDEQGNVIQLRLDNMLLSREDFDRIAEIRTLQSLCLRRTNLNDDLIKHLAPLRKIRHMNLNETAVTDLSVTELQQFRTLKTICLGRVDMSRAGVDQLKAAFERIGIGYSPKPR